MRNCKVCHEQAFSGDPGTAAHDAVGEATEGLDESQAGGLFEVGVWLRERQRKPGCLNSLKTVRGALWGGGS